MPARRGLSVVIPAIIVTIVTVASAQARFDAGVAKKLRESALHGQALDYATDLTRTIGARVSGSAAYQRSADWAAEQFRSAGLTRVALESFDIPHAWERDRRGRGRITFPVDRPLTIESFGWSPSLPDEGIEADVIAGGQDLGASPGRAQGRIVLVTGLFRRDFDRKLKDAGALALLFPDSNADNDISARVRAFGGEIAALPTASVSAAGAELIRELLQRGGRVRMNLAFTNRISGGPVPMPNVIAELPGRELPDDFIVVGAHLDSWDFATGAQDNATGVAMVLEAARAIVALHRPPRRTIRFALWGAEEQGLIGSAAYVRAHEHELDHCVAALNADAGTGRIIGWTTPGRDDVLAAVRDLSRVLLADLHADTVDKRMQWAFDSDGGPFIREGIPTLDMNADDGPYDLVHHKSTDTIDRVNPRNLAVGAAMVAVTAYAVADSPGRIGPRGPAPREP